MKNLIEYISNHVELVALIVSVIFNFLLVIIKSKGSKVYTRSQKLIDVFKAVPNLIVTAESGVGAGNGELKKQIVLDSINALLEFFNIEAFDFDFDNYIESILKTPKKKNL